MAGAYKELSGESCVTRELIHEESMSEPQMIKQTLLRCFFSACHLWAQLNRLKRLGKQSMKMSADFQALVEELFLQLSMKKVLKNREDYKDVLLKVKKGETIEDDYLFDLLITEGEILQELGPMKIELIRSVHPSVAYREGELLGGN